MERAREGRKRRSTGRHRDTRGVTSLVDPVVMDKGHWVDFELTVTGVDASLQGRIGSFAERSVASVELGALRTNGIGATAREAAFGRDLIISWSWKVADGRCRIRRSTAGWTTIMSSRSPWCARRLIFG